VRGMSRAQKKIFSGFPCSSSCACDGIFLAQRKTTEHRLHELHRPSIRREIARNSLTSVEEVTGPACRGEQDVSDGLESYS
jgi:hypothetical protein